ncbi:MAG TPA: polymer-forming cytoskeletal protein [Rhodospirillaceae bacterium]|nr:polymer-forming cytoskeletal protein [Rhodospirillaceae bacterium]
MFSRRNKSAVPPATPSIIGTDCTLTGDVVSQGEVHVDGRVNGDVRCAVLVVGESGFITGEINAETVRVLGSVTGQIHARAVELAKTARVVGDIAHESLAVEAGAYVEGRFNRQPASLPEALPQDAPALLTAANSADADDPESVGKVVLLGN